MSGIQFNKCAINMGKVLKMLDEVEPQINSSYDVVLHKEDLLAIAYICRVCIIDRIDQYPSWVYNNLRIRIPTGLISFKDRNMEEAIEMTIGRLINLSSLNMKFKEVIEDMLSRGEAFYQFEKIIPFQLKQELIN